MTIDYIRFEELRSVTVKVDTYNVNAVIGMICQYVYYTLNSRSRKRWTCKDVESAII